MNYFQVLPNGNLVFPPFRAEDYRQEVHAQVYACLARNQLGSIHSRDVNVRAGNIPCYLVKHLSIVVLRYISRDRGVLTLELLGKLQQDEAPCIMNTSLKNPKGLSSIYTWSLL